MKLIIGYLYPDLLNIYGDRGNIICLKKRCQWRGIEAEIKEISVNNKLKAKECDFFFGGGGQDKQQLIVARDLQKKAKVLKSEADRGVPMLTICGTYQLFGHYFLTYDKVKIPGISIFNAFTTASKMRKIGNIVIKINSLINYPSTIHQLSINNYLVGFENHSGNTFIENNQRPTALNQTLPLGMVIKGFGNNGQDKTEGAVSNYVFGCYLHGPLLPKNPDFADYLIKLALEVKYQKQIKLKPLNDNLEWQAHKTAIKRA